MSAGDEYFMELTLIEAKKALSKGQLPVGSVIVRAGNVIALGHRDGDGNGRLNHAEMIVMTDALSKFSGGTEMTIYSSLEPCIMCFGMLVNVRVARIVFALEDPYGGAAHLSAEAMPLRNRMKFPLISKGIGREESKALFREYFGSTSDPFWQNPSNPLVSLCWR